MEFEIGPENQGTRLDHFLAEQLVDVGRSRIQQWIRNGHVLIETEPARASKRLRTGDRIRVHPQPLNPLKAFPEDISIVILY